MAKRKKRRLRFEPPANPVRPGLVTPMRTVPSGIKRPEYAITGRPGPVIGEPVKTPEVIERMRAAGTLARQVVLRLSEEVAPGVTTETLDRIAHEMTVEAGAYPSPLNYTGHPNYPKAICTSVNEVICHGIPDSRPLEDGDIVNCDVTVYLDGVHGDHSETFLVGEVDERSRRLVDVTRESMYAGIGVVQAGAKVNDIGRAIQTVAEKAGFGVVRDFIGHGIGETFHMAPSIPHYYDPRANTVLETGMTFTIEPMITVGSHRGLMWDDGWTAVTEDLQRTAQFEHTVLVLDGGAEILTRLPTEEQPYLPVESATTA
ncbi:MAG: type I methionyl aminopeptidase [Actinomycetota bacterium]